MATETIVEAPAPPAPASRWEDFVDVFFSPTELFKRRANDSWTVPLIVMIVVGTVLYYAFIEVNGALAALSVTNNPDIPADRQAAALQGIETFKWLGGIAVVLFTVVFTLLFGFLAWLAGKATSIDLPFKRALMINAYLGLLTLVQQVVMNVMLSFKLRSGEELNRLKDTSFGVLRFMEPSEMNHGLVALLSRVDVFAFWQTAWFAIAVVAACKAPKSTAWAVAGFMWLVGALAMLLQPAS